MAIKGKGKTRSRPVAKAPRRMPIEVKPAFLLRRWVQVSGAFIGGILLLVVVIWATNGLRSEHQRNQRKADLARERSAVQAWQGQVQVAVAKVGSATPGSQPSILPDLTTALSSLSKGTVPAGVVKTLPTDTTNAQAAADLLDKYDLVSQIRNKGFDVAQANYLLNSQTRMVEGLQLYGQAAAVARSAAGAKGADAVKTAAAQAAAIQKLAEKIFNEGFSDYSQMLAAVGLFHQPQAPGISGLGGS